MVRKRVAGHWHLSWGCINIPVVGMMRSVVAHTSVTLPINWHVWFANEGINPLCVEIVSGKVGSAMSAVGVSWAPVEAQWSGLA